DTALAADALSPGVRAVQHDRPAAALLDQPRHGHLDGVPDAGEGDVDDVSPGRDAVRVLRAHTRDARAREPALVRRAHRGADGVGEHEVDAAELRDALVEDGLERRLVAYVGLLG